MSSKTQGIRVVLISSTAAMVAVALAALAPATSWAQARSLDAYAVFGTDRVQLGGRSQLLAGDAGSNGSVKIAGQAQVPPTSDVAANSISVGSRASVIGHLFFNDLRASSAAILGTQHPGLIRPLLMLPAPPTVTPGTQNVEVGRFGFASIPQGAYGTISAQPGSTLVFAGGTYNIENLSVKATNGSFTFLRCDSQAGCLLKVRSRLNLGVTSLAVGSGPFSFQFAGTRSVVVGRPGGVLTATIFAPLAKVKLRSSSGDPIDFRGQIVGRDVQVGTGALVRLPDPPPDCGNGSVETGEDCDPPNDAMCDGSCLPDCQCPTPGVTATLHSIGPSVLHNATAFGVQMFGANFVPGATLELTDEATNAVLMTLPTTLVSSTELTALIPAGMPVPSGIERELVARVINPGTPRSNPPNIGHCQVDDPSSPTACVSNADCPDGLGPCVTGDQRLTMFNDTAFLNPNSAAVVPAPHGLCDDGARCESASECTGIGSGACSAKLYVTPQQIDELLVYNTGTGTFADQDAGAAGIQGIPVGDNPFHVEMLTAGGPLRAWVVNRFDDSFSIIDPATDAELARVTGTELGEPGRLRMETEIEFNRAGTRAYLTNANLDEVHVLDISGANRDAPVLLDEIDVGVNPRGMATNAADTRLYVANIQSADVSVVDIAPGSASENQVLATIAARATNNIVGGRANGWEAFVIGGRAPRGIVYSDAHNALFVTSIGPQTGPRQGVVQVGGAIINPTITVIDAVTNAIIAHVAFELFDPNRASCSDPELVALDDVRGRLYVTCQGSGTVTVLDTALLMAAQPAEIGIVDLPLPADAVVPTLELPTQVGAFGAKVCGAFTSQRGAACTTNAQCGNCPTLVEGLPVVCCMENNPVGLHNGPRGIALSEDRGSLYVINQFTTSVATVDVSPASPSAIAVTNTTSYPGAFGSDPVQRDRRLGQIDFFTDVKKTGVSCASCHIDDHQDGVFFEADVRGPRLRRVLSVRGTRDFQPMLQDQLVPDLLSFTDIVVQAERGGPIPCIPCIELNGNPFCFNGGTCNVTSHSENQQNALYAKAITFFPNPNLNPDGSFSTTVPLPGGAVGDATRGAQVFDQLACQGCHPEPMFTIDQLRAFNASTLGAPIRMREVSTPILIPLRARCQDATRPEAFDGSSGFTVPTLRGIWDTFPLLVSGAAGLGAAGSEPLFSPGCTSGSAGCCSELRSPLNPTGRNVPAQHLEVTTKDAMRALLTAPLAVPGSGHGAALGLSPADLNALIAYLRSL